MLDLVHVRSFVALASELHFGRAARRLNMTQPPLSRQIRLLEEQIGTRLFDRTSQAVRLTFAGERFLPHAQALLRQAEDVEKMLRGTDDTEPEGTVRMGFYGAACFRLLPSIMDRITRTYPKVRMELRELNAQQQIDAFSFGELDLGLARPTKLGPGLRADVVLREPLLVALWRDHPLAAHATVSPNDLDQQPFIAYGPEGPHMHGLQRSIFAEHGVSPKAVQSLAHAEAILSLVRVRLGLAIVSGDAGIAMRDDLTFRPLVGWNVPRAVTHLISRTDDLKPVTAHLSRLILDTGAVLEAAMACEDAS